MTPYQRPKRRPRTTNGYVLLDRAWAERLGVRRSGGLYRIGRRELADRLAALSAAKPLVDQLQAGIHALAANQPPYDDLVAVRQPFSLFCAYPIRSFDADAEQFSRFVRSIPQ